MKKQTCGVKGKSAKWKQCTPATTEQWPVVLAAVMTKGYGVTVCHTSIRFTHEYEGRATNCQLLRLHNGKDTEAWGYLWFTTGFSLISSTNTKQHMSVFWCYVGNSGTVSLEGRQRTTHTLSAQWEKCKLRTRMGRRYPSTRVITVIPGA